jgi:hypothetical protein
MSIVRKKDSLGRTYYFNNTTGKRTTESAWRRSHTDKKVSKTQFKTAKAYACTNAGKKLQSFEKGSKTASKYGRALRSCGPEVTNKKGYNQYS